MQTITKDETEQKVRGDLKTSCHLAYKKGLISGFDGNFSLKIDDNKILITPKNSHKGLICEEDFVVIDLDGNILSNNNKLPSSDFKIHIELYKKRPDVKAFIHAHPPTLVSLSISGHNLNIPFLPDLIVNLGEIYTIPYIGLDREQECKLTIEALEKHDALVLEKHGAVTVGKDIFNTLFKMELLEYAAKILNNAYSNHEVNLLSDVEIEELLNERYKLFGKELASREGKLFSNINRPIKLKDLLKKITNNKSPFIERFVSLLNELMLSTINGTKYSGKISKEEREELAKELSTSFLSMTIGRFTKSSFKNN